MDRALAIKYLVWHQRLGEMGRHHYRCLFHMELNLTIVSTEHWTHSKLNGAPKIYVRVLPHSSSNAIITIFITARMNGVSPSAYIVANESTITYIWKFNRFLLNRNRFSRLTSMLIDVYSADRRKIANKIFRTCCVEWVSGSACSHTTEPHQIDHTINFDQSIQSVWKN